MSLERLELLLHRLADANEGEALNAFALIRKMCASEGIDVKDLHLVKEDEDHVGAVAYGLSMVAYEAKKHQAELDVLQTKIATLEEDRQRLTQLVDTLAEGKPPLIAKKTKPAPMISHSKFVEPSDPKKPFKKANARITAMLEAMFGTYWANPARDYYADRLGLSSTTSLFNSWKYGYRMLHHWHAEVIEKDYESWKRSGRLP